MTYAQWDTEVAVLSETLHMLRDGRESGAREVFDRLAPADMVQTEHILIVAAAKGVLASGEKLTVESLRAAIVPNDPARFVEMVFDGLLERKVLEKFSLEDLIGELIERRTLSDQQRSRAARIAADILQGRTALREGAEELVSIGNSCTGPDRQFFLPFGRVDSETDHFPTGAARKHWNPEALAGKDAELSAYEERVRSELATALQALVSLTKANAENLKI
jgi:hypothetical protein